MLKESNLNLHNLTEENKNQESVKLTPEMDPTVWRRFKLIAQRVGGDFNLRVEIIPAGQRAPG